MRKRVALLIIASLTVSSLLMVEVMPASAQSKPSVPEFTAKFVDRSYDVPTTYSIDEYTGERVTHFGYHVENRTIELSIKNQPGSSLFYDVRVKGHFGKNWTELYSYSQNSPGNLPAQSNSEYTVLSIPAFSPNAQIDIQVQAISGRYDVSYHMFVPYPLYDFRIIGTSGWSDTLTLTIPDSQMLTPEQGLILGVVAVASVLGAVIGLLVLRRRRKRFL